MSKNDESIFNSVKGSVCEECIQAIKEIVDPDEEFLLFEGRLKASGRSEAEVTAKTRIG